MLGGAAEAHVHAHEHGTAWWAIGSAWILLALLGWFAVDELRRRFAPKAAPQDATTVIGIDGMNCVNCVRHVEKALTGTDGVTSVEVELEPGQATVAGTATPATLRAAIESAGYRPHS